MSVARFIQQRELHEYIWAAGWSLSHRLPPSRFVLSSVHCALWKGEATGWRWDVLNALINVTVSGHVFLWCETDTLRVSPMLWKKADVLMEKQHPPGVCKWWAYICLRTPLSCQEALLMTSKKLKALLLDKEIRTIFFEDIKELVIVLTTWYSSPMSLISLQ